jgi:hypothetical protein
VSKVRIRSEHCIGFLKGHWPSLWGLRIRINNEKSLQYAALWITTCIHLHMFAMDHENGVFVSGDTFLRQGSKIMREERVARREWKVECAAEMKGECEKSHNVSLLKGKVKREELKEELFIYLNNVE